MTFIRGTINVGLREAIRQKSIDSGFYKERRAEDLEDIDLLVYTAEAGNAEWFEFMMAECEFFMANGRIRKEFRGRFDDAVLKSVINGNIVIATRLAGLGARVRGSLNYHLYHNVTGNRHEMAQLLFSMGGRITSPFRLTECMGMADDRMKEILKKNMIGMISRRFRK